MCLATTSQSYHSLADFDISSGDEHSEANEATYLRNLEFWIRSLPEPGYFLNHLLILALKKSRK